MTESIPNSGICMLAESYYPNKDGGAVHSKLLTERLAQLGASIFIITRRTMSSYPRREIISGIPVTRFGSANKFGRVLRYLGMLSVCVPLFRTRHEYQVIVVATPRILGLPAVLMAKLLGKKCVLKPDTCGEMDGTYVLMDVSSSSPIYTLAQLYFRLRNSVLKRADAFIAISTPVVEEFLEIGVARERIVRIPNGVDIERFAPVPQQLKSVLRRERELSHSAVLFVFCGRLTREKGLVLLLRVWKRLADNFNDIHLLLVGSGDGQTLGCEGELRSFVQENNLSESVTFTGAVKDVEQYLHCADVFVLPSWTENLSLALIEAQACALPAIATRVGGMPDVIDDDSNGLLVTLNDEAEMFDAAAKLIESQEERIRLGSRARETVIKRFSILQVAKRYLSALDEISQGRLP